MDIADQRTSCVIQDRRVYNDSVVVTNMRSSRWRTYAPIWVMRNRSVAAGLSLAAPTDDSTRPVSTARDYREIDFVLSKADALMELVRSGEQDEAEFD